MPQLQQAQIPRCPNRRRLISVKGAKIGALCAGFQVLVGKVVQVERHHALGPFPVRETFQTPDKIEIHLRETLRDKQSRLQGRSPEGSPAKQTVGWTSPVC